MRHERKMIENMKKIIRFSALLALLAAPSIQAQTLNCPQPMIFGTLSIFCTSASSVTLNPDGTRSVTGCFSLEAAPFSEATCTVSQSFPFKTIQVDVPSTYTLTSGGNSMSLASFNLVTNGNGPTYLTSAPFTSVPIGATLSHGVNPQAGSYSGTFTVNAVFQ